jgi:hypothetical protein
MYWFNLIPKSDQDHSPRDVKFGKEKKDYKSICQLPFGATGAINLGPAGSKQGA